MFIEHRNLKWPSINILIVNILFNIVFTLVVTAVIATVNFVLIKQYLNKKFPWHVNNTKRVIVELLSTNITSVSLITVFVIILYHLYPPEIQWQLRLGTAIFRNAVIAMIVNNIVAPFYEAQYLFREWINSRVETEQLKREKAESQYAALRNQINPHFLFNSLNTLLSMVAENPKASQYVESLSDFLRYALQTNEKEAVYLDEELKLANRYIFIQKTRFGDKLSVDINISRQYLDYVVPPFALQMLLENAIKHNVVSREYPLHIKVYTVDDYLTVKNNLHRKSEKDESTGIGLNNIVSRYSFLTDRKVTINEENGTFKVALPLVKMSL
jgi:sensor histidine kinase YesM